MRHTYTDEDRAFIINNYSSNGTEFCAKELGVTPKSVAHQASKLGLKITDKLRGQLVRDTYYRANIKLTENFHDKLFSEWHDFWVYLLGYLWADGNLEKGCNRINFNIAEKDGEHIISLIKKYPEFDFIKYKFIKKRQETWQNLYRFRFSDKNIYLKMVKMGYASKSKGDFTVLNFIPEEKKYLWLLGYFDGDGSLTKENKTSENEIGCRIIQFAGDFDSDWNLFSKSLLSIGVSDFKIIKNINKKGHKGSVVLIQKIDNVVKLLNYIYKKPDFGLPRKFENVKLTSSVYRPHTYNENLKISKEELADLVKNNRSVFRNKLAKKFT